ncbi:MAG: cph [Myxococcaceae bacterium]|nr:cph [Myxococcaceae bacterium]
MTDPVDLTNCEREPIHIPGAIQPHGALLACRLPGLFVEHVSENASSVLGVDARVALGRSIDSFFAPASAAALRLVAGSSRPRDEGPLRVVAVNGQPLDAVFHLAGPELLVIELEPPSGDVAFHPRLRRSLARLAATPKLADLSHVTADEVRALTGFDRVMIYRFDDDWNGEVIAESKREDLESFLGLHYPASDIPAQARRLYTINWLRFIGDVDYVPVPLLSLRADAVLDMSFCTLRSVSPIHCEYLRNMGVTASMSISLLRDEQLWGLIACHHYSGPRVVPFHVRESGEFLGQALSFHLAGRLHQESAERGLRVKEVEAELMRALQATGRKLGQSLATPALLRLTGATGAVVLLESEQYSVGSVPGQTELRSLIEVVRGHSSDDVFVTDRMPALMPMSDELAQVASGVLAVALSGERRDFVFWFRPAACSVVHWAGEPIKQVRTSAGIPRLSPRGSFALWKETVRGRSEPWQTWEVTAAASLRGLVLDGVQRRAAELLEQNDRLLAADRSKDMFLAAVSHELRTPLHAILGWVARLQGGTLDAERTQKALAVVERNALMQSQLVNDLLDVARMVGGKLSIHPRALDLRQVVHDALDAVLLEVETSQIELSLQLGEDDADATVEADPERLQQVTWNLLTNALKFTPKHGSIRLSLTSDEQWVALVVTDSGRGLAASSLPHLFEPFWQVEEGPETTRRGLGLGLAISKHIVELHGGSITASSAGLGQGSSFRLALPRRR